MRKAKDFVYDIEVYPNFFSCGFVDTSTKKRKMFEISERRNDFVAFKDFILKAKVLGYRAVGFNNYGYDYPIVHYILENLSPQMSTERMNSLIYKKNEQIINTPFNNRFSNFIWDRDQYLPQIDLYRIHHFDNNARATGLKILEFNMNSKSIQELPFPPGTVLTTDQMQIVIDYNDHDIDETLRFYEFSLPMIEFREQLSAEYRRDFMNHNDTKIGKDYFIMRLEEELGSNICYEYRQGKRVPRQTHRDVIHLNDVIFDYVRFDDPAFNAVLTWLKNQHITKTKGVFTELPEEVLGDVVNYANLKKVKGKVKNLNCIVDGFQFDFGTGGIHGSVEGEVFESDDEWMIWDWDVTSYYPSLAIVNEVFPQHLGREFCDIYGDMKRQRVGHAKGTIMNAALKLALNGVYGDSNNQFSPFFDPQYTMTITVNGQLLLCMLYEWLRDAIPELKIIQINTDGLTIYVKRKYADDVREVCDRWQRQTNLELEDIEYEQMFIRDVNNYIATYQGGVKRKGAYEYNIQWHQNHNSLVVKKAAEANLLYGIPIDHFIRNHDVDFDFFRRTKVPRNSRLITKDFLGFGDKEILQNITRYFVSKNGTELVKVMPPLPKKPGVYRHIGIDRGWLCTPCNDTNEIDWDEIDYDFYIQESQKLVEPFCESQR